MIKQKLVILFILLFTGLIPINYSFAVEKTSLEDNILIKAFEERKNQLFDIIKWWELTQQIDNLQSQINTLNSWEILNEDIKIKINEDINKLKSEIIRLSEENSNTDEIKNLITEAEQAVSIKNNLLEQLNKESEENNLNSEKIKVLLEKYEAERLENLNKDEQQTIYKYYLFIWFTFFLLILYFLAHFLVKKEKLNKKKLIYLNFFLIFWYIIFLIWFFFYLHPELSIFLIFISGYLLAINAHLIASFVWSIFILERYKIWDIIIFWDSKWQIIKITTINTILLPLTDEGIFANKPIIIPNVELLKNKIIKDENAETFIHRYELKFDLDLWLDVIQLVENIETNILLKRLNNRLNSLIWNEDSYRTSIGFDKYWRISIEFIWRWDDILNKKIERKIMWFFTKTVAIEEDRKKSEEKASKDYNKKQQDYYL